MKSFVEVGKSKTDVIIYGGEPDSFVDPGWSTILHR